MRPPPTSIAEVQNMGSITEDCRFEKSLVPMPWSSRVMGQSPSSRRMFQRSSCRTRPSTRRMRSGRSLPDRDGGVEGGEHLVRRAHEAELMGRRGIAGWGEDRIASGRQGAHSARWRVGATHGGDSGRRAERCCGQGRPAADWAAGLGDHLRFADGGPGASSFWCSSCSTRRSSPFRPASTRSRRSPARRRSSVWTTTRGSFPTPCSGSLCGAPSSGPPAP